MSWAAISKTSLQVWQGGRVYTCVLGVIWRIFPFSWNVKDNQSNHCSDDFWQQENAHFELQKHNPCQNFVNLFTQKQINFNHVTCLFNSSNKVHDLSKNDICLGKIASLIRLITANDTNSETRTCGQNRLLSCVQYFYSFRCMKWLDRCQGWLRIAPPSSRWDFSVTPA